MSPTVKHLDKAGFKKPMVIFPLKQYESLMQYLEDIEDRLAVITRKNEPNVSQQEVEELFVKKFGSN